MKWPDLTAWRERRILARHPMADADWHAAVNSACMLEALSAAERVRLRELATLFLHRKHLLGAHGLSVTPLMAATIAAQACLPVLELGLGWYRGWQTMVVHEDDFVAMQVHHDEHGLTHQGEAVMSGEAWEHGPIVLSWADVAASGTDGGGNVVLHEVAHAIDMLNGDANGFPPLHADMPIADWVAAFSSAFQDLGQRVAAGQSVWPVDPYAIESPAECFAVFTEAFFLHPRELRAAYPQVYAQLGRFYRQDPVDRLDQWGQGQSSRARNTSSTC